jgi:hypothetical protein
MLLCATAPSFHRVYTYEAASRSYYYGPYSAPAYAPVGCGRAPARAAVCLAFSLVGGC